MIREVIKHGLEYFGRYYSKYRAFVYSTEDPTHMSRLKLVIPHITEDKPLDYWAWPTGVFAGEGYGIQVLPKKGDLVWVEFEFGNPRRPLWSHGYFGKTRAGEYEKPEQLKDVNNYWFKTPAGHLIELDDTNSIIRITNTGGKVVEITGDKIHLGKSGGADQAAALGDTLKTKLDSLFDILISSTTMTALGPQPFMPTDIVALQQLKAELSDILSTTITIDN